VTFRAVWEGGDREGGRGLVILILYQVALHTHTRATTDGEWPLGARAPGWSRAPSSLSS